MTEFLICIAGINLISLITFGIDKLCAVTNNRRISEKALLTLTLLGGALGALVGMVLFHHKISKPRFRYTVPIVFLVYLFAILYQLI